MGFKLVKAHMLILSMPNREYHQWPNARAHGAQLFGVQELINVSLIK
jgi:hypothetical protein